MKTLYHYTTVETLLLILNYKTLRFKSLLYVDDPLEPSTSDFGNLGGFKYVSCWTDTPNSIPQWTIYSDNMTGVCIGISFDKETDVFLTEKFSLSEYSVPIDMLNALHPLKLGLLVTNNKYVPSLEQIRYTDDVSLITPRVVSSDDKSITINLASSGIYKTTDWSFQNEQRFSFQIFPLPIDLVLELMNANKGDLTEIINSFISVKPKEYFDLDLNLTIFSNMTITFGKRCSAEDKLKVSKFLEDNKFHIPLFDSTVNIKS
ncbi:DUF2971 domain-containing protein [Streptococcus suis]|nr:DUF2971 domain-containing protein [Streptococcus suis]HEM4224690.1 DUF2971 domain-containing protein [Streptococcus suis]